GREALEKAGVREPWLSTFYELAKAYVRIPRIKVSGVFTVSCLQGDGAERLRRILSSWTRVRDKYPEVKARFYVVGPPKYKLDVEAYDPKLAERFMGEVAKLLLSRAREEGCSADFERLEE
ncbi:MAG: hypothetical protein J7L75_00755, partial [Thermoproteales archaeon]|nr:hypothetical protein [Thermoproteales archaeon]